jgi:hypothetical protein
MYNLALLLSAKKSTRVDRYASLRPGPLNAANSCEHPDDLQKKMFKKKTIFFFEGRIFLHHDGVYIIQV